MLPPQREKPLDPLAPPRRLSEAVARKVRAQVQASVAREAAFPGSASASPGPAGAPAAARPPTRPNGADEAASASHEPASIPVYPRPKEHIQPQVAVLGMTEVVIERPDWSIERFPLEPRLHPKRARLSDLIAFGADVGRITQIWITQPWAIAAKLPDNLSDEEVVSGRRHRFAGAQEASVEWVPDLKGRIRPWLNIRSKASDREFAISLPTLAKDLAFGEAESSELMLASLRAYRTLTKFNFRVSPAVMLPIMIRELHNSPGATKLTAAMAPAKFPECFGLDGAMTRAVWARLLTREERHRKYVHIYDKNGMYLAALSSLSVGFGVPTHVRGPLVFTPKKIGFFLSRITPSSNWPGALPHPGFIRPDQDDVFQWHVTPTLDFAHEHECQIEIAEAWLFPEDHRVFESAYRLLRDARAGSQEAGDEPNRIAGRAIKGTYAFGLGNLDNSKYRESPDRRNLQRPDWYRFAKAQARANMLRNIRKYELEPFGIRTDAIYLTSDISDPIEAAGALPIGTTLAHWKHVMTLPLSALPREFFDGKAADSPQKYLDAIKKVKL